MAAYEPTPEERASWEEWLASAPERVRAVAAKFKPWRPYRLMPHGTIVVIHCVDEPEDEREPITIQVDVTSELNESVTFDRRVFGVLPEDLEEWPGPDGCAP